MRLTQYFLPTIKENPSEAQIASHRLMLRAGMIRQSSAGIYSWLPLGQRILNKIINIVRCEQNLAGAQEMLMPTVQPADIWRDSGRYDAYGPEMLRIRDRHDRDMLYGPTNEEQITEIIKDSLRSYRDLPKLLYHVQWKFRDEVRPRFGVMRGREFLMKDCYSFDLNYEAARSSYNKMFISYLRTFAKMGLQAIPMRADSGPIGGDMSHEFIIIAETGESKVFCHTDYFDFNIFDQDIDYQMDLNEVVSSWTELYAATDERHDKILFDKEVPPDKRCEARGIEVGHIFYFGTKYSQSMGANVLDSSGDPVNVEMGSYGIGVSRLVGAIIEANHDAKGIVWPEAVSPFRVGLINLKTDDDNCTLLSEELYQKMESNRIEVLYEDRDGRAGVKFANMDLIGLPWQLIIGPRGVSQNLVELKCRKTGKSEELTPNEAINYLIKS